MPNGFDHEPQATKWRRFVSRSEWSLKLLGLSKSSESHPGLVLIQIDGFSRTQFERALKQERMPFLRCLLEKEGYQTHPFYSGQPASTPAVQGEIFYGVKGIVPAFSFLDKKSKRIYKMYDIDSAVEIERRLSAQGMGLLEGGSSYSNIYSGGASESHFCSVNLGWNSFWQGVKPLKIILIGVTHVYEIVRVLLLAVLEITISLVDFASGLLAGKNIGKELKFIPTRPIICILLRELITFGAKVDMARGLPVIHMNFIGYDEQAHRRGPSSRFAHWTLKGIDSSIKKIYRRALRSTSRSYEVWIYSDHGQEDTISYTDIHGKTIQQAVAMLFNEFYQQEIKHQNHNNDGTQHHRIRLLGGRLLPKLFGMDVKSYDHKFDHDLIVTAMGPLGHIYTAKNLNSDEKRELAQLFVRSGKIPLVLLPDGIGCVKAWNQNGEFTLPIHAEKILGKNHPHLSEVAKDLVDLCHHPSAGTFIISGWRIKGKPVSFPIEGGAHAGPGSEETNAFALLPADFIKPSKEATFRPADLRIAALRFLNRIESSQSTSSSN